MVRLLKTGMKVHLVGIGGIGLSAIARVLHGWGYSVSGSDLQPSTLTKALAAQGITVCAGHRTEWLGDADLLIISSAVPEENPEVVEARRRGLPVVKREQILDELTAGKTTIAVAGTHGKTTTSAMIAWILTQAELDPTFIVGGVLQNLGTNARAGSGPHFVVEADEYDRTFLGLRPHVAVITVLEHDHPDCYPTFEEMRLAFAEFTGRLAPGGLLIVCGEDAEARRLGELIGHDKGRLETYGLDPRWNWWAEGARLGNCALFEVQRNTSADRGCGRPGPNERQSGRRLGTCSLQVPGRHNVLNALAALAATAEAGVDFGVASAALTRFRGTARRFEVKGQAAGVTVVDDYAHHPTEIRATLAAAQIKYPGRAIWAVFQPHTYSRTATLLNDFAAAFSDADHVVVTGIYAAREQDTLGVSGDNIVDRMDHPDALYVETLDAAVELLLDRIRPGNVIITLGAGDGYLVGDRLLKELRTRDKQTHGGGTGDAGCGRRRQPGTAGSRTGGFPNQRERARALARLAAELQAALGPAAVQTDRSLARHTSLRIGGPAELLVVAESIEALRQAVALAWEHGLPCCVLGGGSNVLVSDAGVSGLVVLNRARAVTVSSTGVRADTGASFSTVARLCVSQGLAGLEWAAGIPGTVGGAVVGNAGAWGGDVASTLVQATLWEPPGTNVEWSAEHFEYSYRTSILKQAAASRRRQTVVLEAEFALRAGERATLEAQVARVSSQRRASQPKGATCGSVFKNPPGDYAGRLIEAAGLKGKRVGNAEISLVHANFVVNHGDASAADVKALIGLARQAVQAQFGVRLEPEIELMGQWPNREGAPA